MTAQNLISKKFLKGSAVIINSLKKKIVSIALSASMVLGLAPIGAIPPVQAAGSYDNNFSMVLSSSTDANRYLTTANSNAFNVVMYNNTYSGVFGDQHMGGIELFLHGNRIATNGDIHYMPTPEQWDATPAPTRGTKIFDMTTNKITSPMTFNGATDGTLKYDLIATPEEGGALLSVVLTSDLPASLAGKARFNMEFIPSKFENKTFQAISVENGPYDTFGVFPLHPQSTMSEVERPNFPTQSWYVQDWNTDRGNSQPLPFVEGYGFTFAAEDELNNISITSDTGKLQLYDARDRAQNGWYVLSNLITDGKKGDTVAKWHIRPKVVQNWVREPNIAFSQVGYSPNQEKFAVIELDKYENNYPSSASLLHVNADGSKEVVYTANVSAPVSWQRYKYVNFDFTSEIKTGMYVIKYGDKESDVFPIANDVYNKSWQSALSGFLAVQMDHIEVRDGDRIWHGAAHMDDGSIGPLGASWFDGMSMPATMPDSITAKGIKPGQHIPGLNVGGWYDAGDFDLQGSREIEVLQDLIFAAEAFNNMDNSDTLSVKWDDKTGGVVQMHKPDGIPDIVQQVAHGIKYVLAQIDNLGGYGGTMELRTLRQYTHLGDVSSDTDGYIYDSTLGPNEIVERNGLVYSGKPDDRVLLLGGGGGNFTSTLTSNTSADIAGAAYLLYDYYPELAIKSLNTALAIWDKERASQPANLGTEWNTLVQLMLATKKMGDSSRFEYFKNRLSSLTSTAFNSNGISSRYNSLFIMDLMDEAFRTQVENAVTQYAATVSYPTITSPFGVQFTTGAGWGGSPTIIGFGQRLAIMYKYFPTIDSLKMYTLRSANYILGRHPANNNSWVSGVGTKSQLKPYNSNRADQSFIPGSILPGHITFAPDFVESLGDFNFLWFENESIINYQSKWISVGMAASMIANESSTETQAPTKDFKNNFMMGIKKTSSTDGYLQTPGFNLFMYDNTFDAALGDKKNAGIELIQSGRRIATNGDISLLNAPDKSDSTIPPVRNSRTVDDVNNTLSASLTIPSDSKGNPAVSYNLKAEPEAGGIKLTVKLDNPLPADLIGKAGFSLQFAPSQFISKSFQADTNGDGNYDSFGVFPLVPQDDMVSAERARTEASDKDNMQPLPFATGKKMTFAAEDKENRIRISSDNGDLSLYDGRNNTQDGWFILRTMIPANATEITWHISPDVKQDWTRKPNVAHSQVGYAMDLSKAAVIELDPNFNAPTTAYVDRLNMNGTYTEVFSGELGAPTSLARYTYRNFDFSSVKDPGMYVIRYAGERTDPFPIKKNVYDRSWQSSLSGFLAVHMDHMTVRESYRIWHNQTFKDDALQAPLNMKSFGGWNMGTVTDSTYAPYEHIPGLAVGGWYNPSGYELDTASNLSVIQDLALAFKELGVDYDTFTMDNASSFVEMHRMDGINDIQQQVKQGILQILGQIENVGFVFKGMKVPTLKQYSQSGDASKASDGFVYDSALASDARYGLKSGRLDDRLAFVGTKNVEMQYDAAGALASAAYALKGFDDALAARCLATAENIWNKETLVTSGTQVAAEWRAAVQLLIATNGNKETYKQFIKEVSALELSTSNFGMDGWKAARVLTYMDQGFKKEFKQALTNYIPVLDSEISNPFGVPVTGGNVSVLNMGVSMSILNKYFPEIVSEKYTLSAANYILGTHMYNDTSWVSGVGTKSSKHGYGSNRADRYFIAGGIVAGSANVLSDFPEAVDDYNYLPDETGYSIETAAKWIVVGKAADTISTAPVVDLTKPRVNISAASHVQPESSFIVKISMDNVSQSVYAQDISLGYDPNIFEYVSVEGANDKIMVVDSRTTPGAVRIISAATNGLTTPSAEILNVTFKAKTNASGSIAVTQAVLGTMPDGIEIEAVLSSKTIVVGTTSEVDKAQLVASISSAETLYANAVVGTQTGQYPQSAKDIFKTAIDAAKAVNDNTSATQAQVDSQVIALNNSKNIFLSSVITGQSVDKTALGVAITNAESLYAEAVVGTQLGQYPQEAKDIFGVAIDAAKSVYNNYNATQSQVDSSVAALNSAVIVFMNKVAYADINNDGIISIGDLAIVAYYYGKDSTDIDWEKAKGSDVNRDNKVDIYDLSYVAYNLLDNK
ncbi:glycoside hydrolase family 9 protein [Paenibacillus chondroitinus]|uniref:Glycoside hydrolase family 9 protein n=1 Tax=Paenibacillus chondroitinus TaxID=59842 RepID=A0ABU6DC04_9BACL|nr:MULTISPECIES: glycoside hydrolase family 9 protein [Paenibacillus]MCY9656435.1 glycoside hydrolase family 9 protein [Paenibacillus anseongense]MEB4795259.1 glycoside hydrolase family 9 protein [Paenibacillus chondroitinus]